ncbi:hypothetical protein EVG20_g103 [Dentipellis fragilis]|uniref:Uncharacterized protein n=1 Tax=Dentipellis fragilis TaxID=205917 RepID=A0A4Y9ZE98_9AGAM|nr:hypothetical protein EVG20_g103 [Dentipellis fragilis]
MIIFMTIIAAVLDLTIVIQRLALGGIHMLRLDGLHLRTLPAGAPKMQIVPAERAAIHTALPTTPTDPLILHFVPLSFPPAPFCPIISLSATCPAHPDNDEPHTTTAQVATPEQALVVGAAETMDFSWFGSEAVEFEVPSDLIVSWTGDLLPHPVIYCDFPPTTSVALFEPQSSDMDFDWPWIYILGFTILSLLVDAAISELRERIAPSFGFVLSFPDISFGSCHWTNLLSGLKNHLNDLGIQATFPYHLCLFHISSLAPYTRIYYQHHYVTSLRIRTTDLFKRLLNLRHISLDVSDLQDLQLWLDSLLDSTWVYIYSCIWEHDPEAVSLLRSFETPILIGTVVHVLVFRTHGLDTLSYPHSSQHDHGISECALLCGVLSTDVDRLRYSVWQNKMSNDHVKKVLHDGLQLVTRYGSLRLNHLQRRLNSAREETASARRTASKLHVDNQALGRSTEGYMRAVASQSQEIKELKASLEKAEVYNLSAVRLRRGEYARTNVRIQQLELDNDNYRSQCAEFKSALEEERTTIVSLRAQLSSRRSPILSDSCTETSPEVSIALVCEHGVPANGADALGLYPEDGVSGFGSCAQAGLEVDTVPVCAYESLVYETDALDLGLEDDSYDSDSDMSECSVVEGTIFIPYNPSDDSSDLCDSVNDWFDDSIVVIPDPPAIDTALHEASRYWTQYAASADKWRVREIEARDSMISHLEQRLEKANESWAFKLSQAQFMTAALREHIEVLEVRIKGGSPVLRDSVSASKSTFHSLDEDIPNGRVLGSHELESTSSASTLDILQMVGSDVSLLLDVSFPGLPHWPSDISFGDTPYVQDPENTNVGSLEESLPVLTPDHPPSGRTPSSIATSVLPELAITSSDIDVTTAGSANDSSDAADFNPPFTPCPIRPSAGKNGDDALFQSGLPSWASFASEISASGFTSSPMDVIEGSPAVNSPIDLPALPSPSSLDQSLSPSPLAARIKHGNPDRPRQPLLSPLNINRSP